MVWRVGKKTVSGFANRRPGVIRLAHFWRAATKVPSEASAGLSGRAYLARDGLLLWPSRHEERRRLLPNGAPSTVARVLLRALCRDRL